MILIPIISGGGGRLLVFKATPATLELLVVTVPNGLTVGIPAYFEAEYDIECKHSIKCKDGIDDHSNVFDKSWLCGSDDRLDVANCFLRWTAQ